MEELDIDDIINLEDLPRAMGKWGMRNAGILK